MLMARGNRVNQHHDVHHNPSEVTSNFSFISYLLPIQTWTENKTTKNQEIIYDAQTFIVQKKTLKD